MTWSVATSFLPGGYNGPKKAGIIKTARKKVKTYKAKVKSKMYKYKLTDVKKDVFWGTVKYVGSSFVATTGEYFLNPMFGG